MCTLTGQEVSMFTFLLLINHGIPLKFLKLRHNSKTVPVISAFLFIGTDGRSVFDENAPNFTSHRLMMCRKIGVFQLHLFFPF